MISSKEATKIAVNAMEEKKAEDIRIIEISEVSSIADYFIIANGNNVNQVHSISDFVEEQLAKSGIHPKQIEGYTNANWVLMDYGDLIIHIFDKENRLFYNLERIWRDGKQIGKEEL
ncbi:MAG: ribosome silencing factor [Lachnospiraceae bacterium]